MKNLIDNSFEDSKLKVGTSIFIKKTKDKGYGVFAECDLPENFIVEISPVLVVSDTNIPDHELYWDGINVAIGLGYLMLYNHCDDSNVAFIRSILTNKILVITKRKIQVNEELTIHYECPLWFEQK